MEKAGIHLPAEQQARMRQLMNASNHYAAQFNAALVSGISLRPYSCVVYWMVLRGVFAQVYCVVLRQMFEDALRIICCSDRC